MTEDSRIGSKIKCEVVEGGSVCGRSQQAHGYCSKHLYRWQRYGDPLVLKSKRYCTVIEDGETCGGTHKGHGMCNKHLQRWRHNGDPLVTKTNEGMPTEERFWLYVNKDGPIPDYAPDLGPCWIWTGTTTMGYGRFWLNSGTIGAHEFTYKLFVGPIPEELELDHLCRVRACCNPDHLEAVTHLENLRRSPITSAGKTHCKYGHEFTPENTYIFANGDRGCKECGRAASLEYQRKKRAVNALVIPIAERNAADIHSVS